MTDETVRGIRKQLLGLRNDCLREARKQLRETHVGHPRMNPSQNHGGCSDPEEISETINIELVRLNDHTCRAVDQALARLKVGTYGICVYCEEFISSLRLKAIPYATLCIACKEADEEGSQKEPQTRSPFLTKEEASGDMSESPRMVLAEIGAKTLI